MSKKSKILVEDISKEFGADKSQVQALKNIDLVVSEGAFVSIVGPSGCGKSTLLCMLGGFVPPSLTTKSSLFEVPCSGFLADTV